MLFLQAILTNPIISNFNFYNVITLELFLEHHNTYTKRLYFRVLTSSASISSPNSSSTFLSTVGVVGVVGTAVAGDVGVSGGRYQDTFKALPLMSCLY